MTYMMQSITHRLCFYESPCNLVVLYHYLSVIFQLPLTKQTVQLGGWGQLGHLPLTGVLTLVRLYVNPLFQKGTNCCCNYSKYVSWRSSLTCLLRPSPHMANNAAVLQ